MNFLLWSALLEEPVFDTLGSLDAGPVPASSAFACNVARRDILETRRKQVVLAEERLKQYDY